MIGSCCTRQCSTSEIASFRTTGDALREMRGAHGPIIGAVQEAVVAISQERDLPDLSLDLDLDLDLDVRNRDSPIVQVRSESIFLPNQVCGRSLGKSRWRRIGAVGDAHNCLEHEYRFLLSNSRSLIERCIPTFEFALEFLQFAHQAEKRGTTRRVSGSGEKKRSASLRLMAPGKDMCSPCSVLWACLDRLIAFS